MKIHLTVKDTQKCASNPPPFYKLNFSDRFSRKFDVRSLNPQPAQRTLPKPHTLNSEAKAPPALLLLLAGVVVRV